MKNIVYKLYNHNKFHNQVYLNNLMSIHLNIHLVKKMVDFQLNHKLHISTNIKYHISNNHLYPYNTSNNY